MLIAREVGRLISNPDTLENIRQTLSLLLVRGKQTILPVQFHLTCSQHLGLLDLRSTELNWWLLVCLIWRVSNTATLCLVILLLLSSGLVNLSSILLCNLALHHVNRATFKFLANSFLLTFPLRLLGARFDLLVVHLLTFHAWPSICILVSDLSCDNSWSVNVVESIIQNVEVDTIFWSRFF